MYYKAFPITGNLQIKNWRLLLESGRSCLREVIVVTPELPSADPSDPSLHTVNQRGMKGKGKREA